MIYRIGAIILVVCFIVAAILLDYVGTKSKSEIYQTAEQFVAELAEKNRRADVASQLRAAERGYLAEMNDGSLQKIYRGRERVWISGFSAQPVEFFAPLVKRVIRPTDPDWGEKSYDYLANTGECF